MKIAALTIINELKTMIRHVACLSRFGIPSALAVVLCCSLSSAQSKGAAGKTASKRTTINFEDQLVEGQTQKPELFYLLQQRNNNFKRLIRLRENFLPEMRKTSEDVGKPLGLKGGG